MHELMDSHGLDGEVRWLRCTWTNLLSVPTSSRAEGARPGRKVPRSAGALARTYLLKSEMKNDE
jgi:hypothetical protein